MSEPVTLEVFSDYVCPWCYLSTARIEKLKQAFDIKTVLVHFPLHPDTPPEGQSLEALLAGRGIDLEDSYNRMKAMMDEEGLPYGRRTHTYNSRLAQELGKWAETQPGGEAIHDALYRAYFVDGIDISQPDRLIDIAQSAGLSAELAKGVLTDRSFKDAVDADWIRSRNYGVTGVPTFAAGGYGVVGAQPYDILEKLLTEVGAVRRT